VLGSVYWHKEGNRIANASLNATQELWGYLLQKRENDLETGILFEKLS
jgi:hypothetical protein